MKLFGIGPRFCRRFVARYFGSTKRFLLFLFAVAIVAYFVNHLYLNHEVTENVSEFSAETIVQNTTQSPEELRCGVKQTCPAGKYPYYVKSGFLEDGVASICFRGKYYVGSGPGLVNGRGISMVVINENTLQVEDVRIFDTFDNDEKFRTFLSVGIPDYRVVIATTQDDVTHGLSAEGRKLLQGYGSAAIHKVEFRENFAMIGQKGLTRGTAIEEHLPRSSNRLFGDVVELSGCLSVPIGRMFAMVIEQKKMVNDTDVNCGVATYCGADSFPVRLYSGLDNVELPRMCINGQYILRDVAGRGINVAVVNNNTKEVVKMEHFDTYEFNNATFVPFLESMKVGEIVLAVTHDEATRMLSDAVRAAFEALGSSYIRKLTMRDAWGFVGQKGMVGRSSIEELEFAPAGAAKWSNPVDKRLCVPLKMKGFTLKFEALVTKNSRRDEFCSKYIGYGEFCNSDNRMDLLTPAPLGDASVDRRVFTVPIAVVAGSAKNVLRQQLESVLSLPGIVQNVVKVFYDKATNLEYEELIKLFGFRPVNVDNVKSYTDLMTTALQDGWSDLSNYLIVLEEEVFPTTDYLQFLSQCLNVLDKDQTLIGISAWNDNGYYGASYDAAAVYRTETFPGLGFLLKRDFYTRAMKDKMADCCGKRSWEGWWDGKLQGSEMIVPEVSRVTRRPLDGPHNQSEFLLQFFNRRRVSSVGNYQNVTNVDLLYATNYESDLEQALKSAIPLVLTDLKSCLSVGGPEFIFQTQSKGKNYVVYYEQESPSDEIVLQQLCKCFQLFSAAGQRSRGTHRGLLRFSYNGNKVFLVGSSTTYYRHKPDTHPPLKRPATTPSSTTLSTTPVASKPVSNTVLSSPSTPPAAV